MNFFGKEIEIIDKKFKANKAHYLLQCLIATVPIILILIVLNTMFKVVIIASFGATAFLIFTMPHLRTSQGRSVLGGYFIGIILGILLYHLASIIFINFGNQWIYQVMGGFAVGLSILIMTMTNTEHPPAAGLALGLVLEGYNITSVIIIFVAVLALFGVKYLLRNWLINLY